MPVKRTGDFGKALKVFENVSQNFIQAEKKILAGVALKAEQLAVDRIKSQPSEWKKLSSSYLEWKVSKGYSPNMLTKTSTMIQAITSGVVGLVGYAGVPKTARNKEGESVANIAATHEYGSVKMNIPARPVWQIVHRQTIQYILFTDTITQTLKEALLRGIK
jgi:hypothetical protein